MKQYYDVIIVIPVGPGSSLEFIIDTINSYIFFTKSAFKFIIADDSQQGLGKMIQQQVANIDVVTTQKNMGWLCGLYINLSVAYKYALDHYDFLTLFKLDTDALIINHEPEKDAVILFSENKKAGMAGQYPLNYNGTLWDLAWPRKRILNGMHTWKFFRRPMANMALKKWYKLAVNKGYRAGESVFGGAYFMSKSMLGKLDENGLLPSHKLKSLNLGEDHIFSLLTKAVGFDLCSLSINKLPFGCAWKGLPGAPQQLLDDNKKIIHSVRYWGDMKEKDIRNFFKQKRREQQNIFSEAEA